MAGAWRCIRLIQLHLYPQTLYSCGGVSGYIENSWLRRGGGSGYTVDPVASGSGCSPQMDPVAVFKSLPSCGGDPDAVDPVAKKSWLIRLQVDPVAGGSGCRWIRLQMDPVAGGSGCSF